MERREYVGLGDILGVRVTCKCGAVLAGSVDALTKIPMEKCPAGCEWRNAADDYEAAQGRTVTAAKRFVRQLRQFQNEMTKPQGYSFALEIATEERHVKDSV